MSNRSFTRADALTACFLTLLVLCLSHVMLGCGDGGDGDKDKDKDKQSGGDGGEMRFTSNSERMENASHIRGITRGLILFAQGNGDRYPGLKSDGAEAKAADVAGGNFTSSKDGYHPQLRYAILLNGGFFTPEDLVAPTDDKTAATPGEVTADNYSYAMLMISEQGATRKREWSATTNSQAPVMSDRNLGGAGGDARSIHDNTAEAWVGHVAYNDSRVEFEKSNMLDNVRFGSGPELKGDDLFAAGDKMLSFDQDLRGATGFDAAMCFAKPDDLTNQK